MFFDEKIRQQKIIVTIILNLLILFFLYVFIMYDNKNGNKMKVELFDLKNQREEIKIIPRKEIIEKKMSASASSISSTGGNGVFPKKNPAPNTKLQLEEPFTLTLDKNGNISYRNERIDHKDLKKILFNLDESRKIYLRADRDLSYGSVVNLMSMLKANGLSNIAFVVDTKPSKATKTTIESISEKIKTCWLVANNAENRSTTLKVRLNRDGTLVAVPEVVGKNNSDMITPAELSAIRAVQRCAPYEKMPLDQYSNWKEFTINFVPE